MSTTGVYTPLDYEERLRRYLFERSEEGRAVRVGEKEISEQAEIVARYTDLFTREQLESLLDAERAASGDEREQLYRLRKVCEGGIVSAELVEREDALENDAARGAGDVPRRGAAAPRGAGAARGHRRLPRARGARRAAGRRRRDVQRREARPDPRRRRALCRAVRGARPGGAQRGGEGDRAAAPGGRAGSCRRRRPRRRS